MKRTASLPEAGYDIAWEKGRGAKCDREIFMKELQNEENRNE